MIFNSTGLTSDSIIFNFDISNLSTGFTVTSTTFWNRYRLKDLVLTGYSENAYDFGLTTSYTDNLVIKNSERNLVFHPIGVNDASGNTIISTILFDSGTTEGSSFILSGGYLSTFFKIENQQYQLSKYRFENGFTIDTWLYLDNESFSRVSSFTEGNFLYFGTKAENKLNSIFSGLTNYEYEYQDYNFLEDIEYNAFSFKINNNRTLSLRYLGISAETNELQTSNTLPTGWTNIAITFKNCRKIEDGGETDSSENFWLDCIPRRNGNLKIYVNGRIFYEKDEVEEFFWLKGNEQVGIPYTINWGGGSTGLKNSYVYSTVTYTSITESITSITSSTNFINGLFLDVTGLTTTLSGSNITPSTDYILSGTSSLKINNQNITSNTFTLTNDNFILFDPVILQPNKLYTFSGSILQISGYTNINDQNIFLDFQPQLDSENISISSLTFNSGSTLWSSLIYKFITPSSITGTTSYTPLIKVLNISSITNNYLYYLNSFSFKYDIILTTDTITTLTRNDLINPSYKSIIQENFDGSFYGKIQKLTLYERDLKFTEIKKNYNYFSNRYGFVKIK